MNQLTVIGNLTRKPELRSVNTAKGAMSVTELNLAVNGRRKSDGTQDTTYFRATLWGKQAENAAQYLDKGRKVMVQGEAGFSTYAGKDGQTHVNLEINFVSQLEYLSPASGTSNSAPAAPAAAQAAPVETADDVLPF